MIRIRRRRSARLDRRGRPWIDQAGPRRPDVGYAAGLVGELILLVLMVVVVVAIASLVDPAGPGALR